MLTQTDEETLQSYSVHVCAYVCVCVFDLSPCVMSVATLRLPRIQLKKKNNNHYSCDLSVMELELTLFTI